MKLSFSTIIGILAVIAMLMGSATMAFADSKCKDVNIKVTNNYKYGGNKVKIKVLAVNYKDKEDGKWRDNDLKNTEISYGITKSINEDLEYVGNEDVPRLQVKFKFLEDKGWSSEKWSNVKVTTAQKCIANKTYTITVTGTDSKK